MLLAVFIRPYFWGTGGGSRLRSPHNVDRFFISEPHLKRLLFPLRMRWRRWASTRLDLSRQPGPWRFFHLLFRKGTMDVSKS